MPGSQAGRARDNTHNSKGARSPINGFSVMPRKPGPISGNKQRTSRTGSVGNEALNPKET
jgi:hypothetical protein